MSLLQKIFLSLLLLPLLPFAQQPFITQLKAVKGITVTQVQNSDFKEYYEIMVEQPLDHFHSNGKVFNQRIFVGINNPAAPIVMETEGYAVNKITKPEFIKDCNEISVEHRYFGKSLPDSLDWTYLTVKQAAYDCHHIHELFAAVLTGKWLTSGISKGGQMAVAYKMFFPNDADATIAYVTPIKKSLNDIRIVSAMDSLAKTESGKRVFAFQKNALKNKAELLKAFDSYVQNNNYRFGKMKNETVLEYMLLEYPFAFFQNCSDTNQIPLAKGSPSEVLQEVTTVVPVWFFTESFKAKLQPSFYMFYHELGYYEYNIAGLKQWLSAKSYPNNIFAPQNAAITFDPTYLNSLQEFITKPGTQKLIFIYGEFDPYTAAQAPIDNNNNCLKLIVKNGCHKSRVADLSPEQQRLVFDHLSGWLQWPVSYSKQ